MDGVTGISHPFGSHLPAFLEFRIPIIKPAAIETFRMPYIRPVATTLSRAQIKKRLYRRKIKAQRRMSRMNRHH